MPKGAVHRNEPAKNYKYKMDITSSPETGDNESNVHAIIRLTWGLEYSPTVTGIEVKCILNNTALDVATTTTTITTPWGTEVFNDSGWSNPTEILVEIDDQFLSVSPSCGFTYGFEELRLYIGGVLRKTITANGQSGDGFDLRHDILYGNIQSNVAQPIPACLYVEPTVGPSECLYTFDEQPTQERTFSSSMEIGYQWWDGSLWQSDDISFKTPPTATCDCGTPVSHPGGTISWEVNLTSVWEYSITKTEVGVFECSCTIRGTSVLDWYTTETTHQSIPTVKIIPETSEIFDHLTETTITCNDNTDITSSTTTELETFCNVDVIDLYGEAITYCRDELEPPPICGAEEECEPPFPTYLNTVCCFSYDYSISWPTLPQCTVILEPSITHDIYFGHMYSGAISDNDVYLTNSTFNIPIDEYITNSTLTNTGDITSFSLSVSKDGIVYASYISEADGPNYKISTNQGTTWSTEIALPFTGSPKYIKCETNKQNGDVLFMCFKYISGTSGPGYLYCIRYNSGLTSIPAEEQVIDSSGNPIEIEDESFDVSWGTEYGMFILTCKLSGDTAPSYLSSADSGKSFTEVY